MASAAKTAEKPDETGSENQNAAAAGTAVAVSGGAAVPAFLAESVGADAGAGLSTDSADNIVPLLYVLQSNSPQVNQRGPDAVKGAKPGDLWIKGTNYTFDGETGLVVQPCAFSKDWVEWIPRKAGGGYVGRHDKCPEDAVEQVDSEGRKRMTLPNGNEVNETRYHYVLHDASPLVIPMSSTGHTTSRDWMHKMNGIRLPDRRSAPSFATTWRLTTKQRSNKSGEWFAIVVEQEGWVQSTQDYELGKKFNESVMSGAVRAADEDESQRGGPTSGSGAGSDYDPETGEIRQSTSSRATPGSSAQVPF